MKKILNRYVIGALGLDSPSDILIFFLFFKIYFLGMICHIHTLCNITKL